jgi:hypothetical protein
MADLSIYRSMIDRQVPTQSLGDHFKDAMTMKQLATQNKHAEQTMAQEQQKRRMETIMPAMEQLASMPVEQRKAAFPQVQQQLIQSGALSPEQAMPEYDDGLFNQTWGMLQRSPEYIERQKAFNENELLKAKAAAIGPDTQLDRDYKRAQIGHLGAQTAKDRAEAAKTANPSLIPPAERLSKMGGEVKQKLGFITSGLQALTNYEDAFRTGGRQSYINPTTPLVGSFQNSTPIDEARTSIEEAIGRLASGGAINSGEEARFRKMIPTAADTDESAARKMLSLRRDMEGKLTAYGFKSGELGGLGLSTHSTWIWDGVRVDGESRTSQTKEGWRDDRIRQR